MGSTCCGRGKEGTASAPPRKHGEEPTARRELADPLPALSRGPLRRGTQPRWLKCAVNQSPCSARHGDSHCLGELRQDGKVKEVSAGVLSPREPPRLVPPVGHRLSKKGTTMSPGEASALGPRAPGLLRASRSHSPKITETKGFCNLPGMNYAGYGWVSDGLGATVCKRGATGLRDAQHWEASGLARHGRVHSSSFQTH